MSILGANMVGRQTVVSSGEIIFSPGEPVIIRPFGHQSPYEIEFIPVFVAGPFLSVTNVEGGSEHKSKIILRIAWDLQNNRIANNGVAFAEAPLLPNIDPPIRKIYWFSYTFETYGSLPNYLMKVCYNIKEEISA